VGNGYYTLGFTLLDTGIVVAGAVDVVRIVTGQTTSGTYAFSTVNAPGGTIQVNINANMQNPLNVAIAGSSASLSQGSTQTLTASVSNYTGNVVYVWYVNGVSAATGSSFTFGSGTTAGYTYRIDVTAFTADGTQAGSATTNVQETTASQGSVTYNANGAPSGAVPIDSKTYQQGAIVTTLGNTGNLTYSGYNFAGWTTNPNTTGASASYAAGATFAMGTANVTLYAVWIPTSLTFTSSGTSITINGATNGALSITGTLTIPIGATSIGNQAFEECYNITSVTVPSSITSIGENAVNNPHQRWGLLQPYKGFLYFSLD
jgi:uncharacterized repeat protein (TIGR02543 family)